MRVQSVRTRTFLAGLIGLVTVFSMPAAKAAPRNLILQIHSVKCMDETTGKWREKVGVDTIALGGIAIDPKATVTQFKTWHVGEFKKDGVVRKSSPPHELVTMAFNGGQPFPQKFQAVLVLAELDPGKGLEKQLAKIAAAGDRAARDKLKSTFGLTRDALIKQAQSGKVQPLEAHLADIGEEILKVKAEEWWADDLFPPMKKQLTVPREDFRFRHGKLESPHDTLIFTGKRIMGSTPSPTRGAWSSLDINGVGAGSRADAGATRVLFWRANLRAPDLVVAGTHDDVSEPLSATRLLDAGDGADALVDRLRADVARAVRHVCPDWLADQADDLTQIATTRVLDRIRATSGSVTFTAGYVYRAAYSALIDEIRKRRRLREVPLEPDLMARSHLGDPERQAGARSIREALAGRLAALMVSRRRAVTLHLQGHSFGEIATLLSCAKKKAENLVIPRPDGFAHVPEEQRPLTVSGDADFSRRLADALRAGQLDARPREDCPSADDIWRAVHSEGSTDDRLKVIDHVGDCASCAEAWQLAMALEKDRAVPAMQPVASRPWFQRSEVWGRVAAAIVIVVAGTWLIREWREPRVTPGVRDQAANAIRSLLPENASLPRQDFVLRWSNGSPGTRYDLVVTTTTLDVIVEARGLERTEYRVAPERLASLASGSRVYWRVVASMPDGSTRSSATHAVTVQ